MKGEFITKYLSLNAFDCPTLGWYLKHSDSTEPTSLPDQLRMEEGIEVHKRARELFPEGVLISGDIDPELIDYDNYFNSEIKLKNNEFELLSKAEYEEMLRECGFSRQVNQRHLW